MDKLLLEQDVERALRRENIEHPLLQTLEQYTSDLTAFSHEYRKVLTSGRQFANEYAEQYTKEHFGFFMDAIEEVGDFNPE